MACTAIIPYSSNLVLQTLNLPKDAKIVEAVIDNGSGNLILKIEHHSLPEIKPGEIVPWTAPKVKMLPQRINIGEFAGWEPTYYKE